MGKAWPALEIALLSDDPALCDRLLAALDDFQPTALEEDVDGEASRFRVYFTGSELRDAAADAVARAFSGVVSAATLEVPDENWAERSQAELGAIAIGRLVVAPPWQTDRYRDAEHLVVILPSMGFGTGHHATTRLTLQALQGVGWQAGTMLDIGCGSGVLALAAAKLGASSAVGIDIDPDALANAVENAELNGLTSRVRFELGDFRQSSYTGDVVAANLTGALLAGSAKELAATVKPHGWLLISGFLESEKETVLQTFDRFLTRETLAQEGEWLSATYRSRHT